MSFQTKRPETAQEKIAKILEQRALRKENVDRIMENARVNRTAIETEAAMESAMAQQKQSDTTSDKLNKKIERYQQQKAVRESYIHRASVVDKVRDVVMNKVLFEMVFDAYWLDDRVKQTVVQETYNKYKDIIQLVESVCPNAKTTDNQKTDFIKSIESAVQESCEKIANRLITEAKQQGKLDIDFKFTEEEELELDKKIEDLGRDEIVDLVKAKVMTVIQDEKERGKQKAEMIQEIDSSTSEDSNIPMEMDGDGTLGSDNEKNESVQEDVTLNEIATTLIIGAIVTCVTLSAIDKIELKKALKIYEKHYNPSVKANQLSAAYYALDRADRMTNKELHGLKKFFNKNSHRARIWKTDKGDVVCSNILYTTMDGTGTSYNTDGTIGVNTYQTFHYLYDINPKYKKDSAYLYAYMCLQDGMSNKGSLAFVEDIKNEFPSEMKNTKVRLFGKNLESCCPEDINGLENMPGNDVEVVIPEENNSTVANLIDSNFIQRDIACDLVNKCGAGSTVAEATYYASMESTDSIEAVSLLKDYESILRKSKLNVTIAPSSIYTPEIKAVVNKAIDKQIKICQEACVEKEKEIQESCDRPKATLESLKLTAKKRQINNSSGKTLFESLMMSNAKSATEQSVMEGHELQQSDVMNAALIESILQYTVLETLNTTKLYQFKPSDVSKLRVAIKQSIRN